MLVIEEAACYRCTSTHIEDRRGKRYKEHYWVSRRRLSVPMRRVLFIAMNQMSEVEFESEQQVTGCCRCQDKSRDVKICGASIS